jgi:hypothetical protein
MGYLGWKQGQKHDMGDEIYQEPVNNASPSCE